MNRNYIGKRAKSRPFRRCQPRKDDDDSKDSIPSSLRSLPSTKHHEHDREPWTASSFREHYFAQKKMKDGMQSLVCSPSVLPLDHIPPTSSPQVPSIHHRPDYRHCVGTANTAKTSRNQKLRICRIKKMDGNQESEKEEEYRLRAHRDIERMFRERAGHQHKAEMMRQQMEDDRALDDHRKMLKEELLSLNKEGLEQRLKEKEDGIRALREANAVHLRALNAHKIHKTRSNAHKTLKNRVSKPRLDRRPNINHKERNSTKKCFY